MSANKKGFSYLKVQFQLGLGRYETAFNMMHEIRVFMGKRDALYSLTDMLEYDEVYIRIATLERVKENLKRKPKESQGGCFSRIHNPERLGDW